MRYFCDQVGNLAAVQRVIANIVKAEGCLVSVVRHGSGRGGIMLADDTKLGYVVTYFCHQQCGTWEYT